jgi:pimeloyl-ACP methyl ester carboxylesterase
VCCPITAQRVGAAHPGLTNSAKVTEFDRRLWFVARYGREVRDVTTSVARVTVDHEPDGGAIELECRRIAANCIDSNDTASVDADERRVTFVLVHGLASNARMWDGVANALGAQGFSSVAIDLRSHGRSSKTDLGNNTVTAAHDVAIVVDRLALGRVVVVGQSWGGNVAVELAARHSAGTLTPSMALASIVCVDGGFIELSSRFADSDSALAALTPPALIGTPSALMEARIRAFSADWPEVGIQGSLANFEFRNDGTVAPWLTLDRHLDIVRSLLAHHPSKLWPAITVPVQFLVPEGGDDDWSQARRREVGHALDVIANGGATWFANGVHDIHAQQPDNVAAALIALGEKDF